MKRHIFPPGDTFEEPGTWEIPPDFTKPIVSCPKCGGLNLGDDAPHHVEPNGDVNASLICAHGCGFHAFITLERWNHFLVRSKSLLDSCDFCEAQEEGGHYCLLHSCQLKNANLWTCQDFKRSLHREAEHALYSKSTSGTIKTRSASGTSATGEREQAEQAEEVQPAHEPENSHL